MGLPPKPDDMKHFSKHGATVKLLALFIMRLPYLASALVVGLGILVAKHYI